MDAPHLAKGSSQPVKIDGKLRLYSSKFCPFAQRVWLVLEAKQLPYDIVNINLIEKPDWLFNFHPEGKVPALDTGTEVILESLDICDFLDDEYADVAMYSAEPAEKQKDKDLIQKIAPIIGIFMDIFFNKTTTNEEKREQIWPHLEAFENELCGRGTKFFTGDEKPGMVDYMLWPFAQRAKSVKIALKVDLLSAEDLSKLLLLRAWIKRMNEDAAVKATYTTPEQFYKAVLIKIGELEPDYDNI